MNNTLTIEALEALANSLSETEGNRKRELARLISAYARIIAHRTEGRFPRRSLHVGDEAGHWDNSFPPKMEYTDRRGPGLLKVIADDHEDIATSSGFYYSWRRETTNPGLWVSRDGEIYGRYQTGTGRVGQFAAHPGDCGVDIDVTWEIRPVEDIYLETLEDAEKQLREIVSEVTANK